MNSQLSKLYSILDYNFNNEQLIFQALTHSSYSSDTGEANYERLEFLGDAILGDIVARYLYDHYNVEAGELSKWRAKLVNANILGDIVLNCGIANFVRTGKSVKQVSHNIYADVYESILAAIQLDGGDAAKFVYSTLLTSTNAVNNIISSSVDYKTKLQELVAKRHGVLTYAVINSTGAGDSARFTVGLTIDGNLVCTATNKSIKLAEQNCAEIAINKLFKNA